MVFPCDRRNVRRSPRIVFCRFCRKVTYRVVTCSDVTRMSLNLNASVTLADSSSRTTMCMCVIHVVGEIHFHASFRAVTTAFSYVTRPKREFTYIALSRPHRIRFRSLIRAFGFQNIHQSINSILTISFQVN